MSNERNDATAKKSIRNDIISFAIKACIAAAIVIFSVNWIVKNTVATVEASTERTVDNIKSVMGDHIGGREFWSKLEKELDRAAGPASELPPEKKQKLLNDVRVIAARWRPFLDAIQEGAAQPPINAK